jgi:hypothetical protein
MAIVKRVASKVRRESMSTTVVAGVGAAAGVNVIGIAAVVPPAEPLPVPASSVCADDSAGNASTAKNRACFFIIVFLLLGFKKLLLPS